MKLLPAIASLGLANAFPITEFHHTVERPSVKETPTLQEQYNDEMSIDLNNLLSSVDSTLKNLMSIPILSMDVWHMPNGEEIYGNLPKQNVFQSIFPSKRMFSPIQSSRFVDIDASEDAGETTFENGKTTTKHDYVKKVLDTLTGKINEEHIVSTDVDDGVHNIMHSEIRTSSDNTQTSSFTSSSFSDFNNINKIDDSFNWLMDKRGDSLQFLENNVDENDDSEGEYSDLDADSEEEYSDLVSGTDEEYSDSQLDLLDDSDMDSDDEQMLEDSNIDVFDDKEVDPNSVVMKVTNDKIKELEDRIASLRQVQSDIQTKINKNEDMDTYEEEESDYDEDEDDYDDENDYDDDPEYDEDEDVDYDDEDEDYDDEDEDYDDDDEDYDEYKENLDDKDYENEEEYNNSIFEKVNEDDNSELSKVISENYSKTEQTSKSAVKIIDAEDSNDDIPDTLIEVKVVPEPASATKIIKDENTAVKDKIDNELVTDDINSIKEPESIKEQPKDNILKDSESLKAKVVAKKPSKKSKVVSKPSKKSKTDSKPSKKSNKIEKVNNQKKGKKVKTI